MTWVIKVQYINESKPWELPSSIQQVLTDEMVESVSDATFDVRVAYFKRLLNEIDEELKNEN
jgi:hypothetical protein